MSSVVAILNRNGEEAERGIAERMLAARPERGRDGREVWQDGPVAVGHGRFVVLPEERDECQPLVDGDVVLSADIRLDNRPELGAALGLTPEQINATSDAQLLLLSYRRWGIDCLPRLLGDFAFVLWDGARRQLFAARDALGERGLCYTLDEAHCLVASDIVHLLAHPDVVPRINDDRVASYLALVSDRATETFYRDIQYFPPGHGLTVGAEGARLWSYWSIEPDRAIRYRRDEEYAEHLLSLLTEAVRCRLRSVGPVGISLSGGLDSASLAALAAPMLPGEADGRTRLRSYSYAFEELSSCDERHYIQPLTERYGIFPTYLNCDDKWTLKDLDEWPVSPDRVLVDAFAPLPATVMRAAGEDGTRLLLAGYFGDTLSSGGQYWALDMFRHGRWGEMMRVTAANARTIRTRRTFFENGLRRLIPPRISGAYRRVRPRRPRSVAPGISEALVNRTDLRRRLSPAAEDRSRWPPGLWERYHSLSPEQRSQGYSSVRYQYNLHGIELVQPYYDRRLIEFVLAVPAYILGLPGSDRRLHREAMKGLLPDEIRLRRSRTSFAPLYHRGVKEREWEKVRRIMAAPQVVERGYIDAEWLRGRLESGMDDSLDSTILWRALCLELWLQRHWT